MNRGRMELDRLSRDVRIWERSESHHYLENPRKAIETEEKQIEFAKKFGDNY